MKKWLFGLLLVIATSVPLEAQTRIWAFRLDANNQIGPDPQNYLDLRGTGISTIAFIWHATGTVSAGACALQGGADSVSFGTTVIAAETVTASGGPTTITAVTTRFNRINCTTPISGSGAVDFVVMGWTPGASAGSVTLTLEQNVDDTAGATDAGIPMLCVRDDALATLTPADGDYTNCRVSSTGAMHVTVANLTTDAAEDSAVTSNPVPVGGVMRSSPVGLDAGDIGYLRLDTDSSLYARVADPCSAEAKTYVPIDIVTATTVELANAVASEFFYICSIDLHTNAANNVVIAEDDTDGCGSISAGVTGGTTAAEGYNFGANGGRTIGNGNGSVAKTTTANRYLCILTSAATQLSGVISFVSAP